MSTRVNTLLEAVSILSADSAGQLDYLRELGLPEGIDELALEFDAIAAAAEDMLRLRELDKNQYDCVKRLNGLLSEMSGEANSTLWTAAALSSAPEWNKVRIAARECLQLLGRVSESTES